MMGFLRLGASLFKSRCKKMLLMLLAITSVYGVGRLYYRVTDGFLESNIQYDLPFNSHWSTVPLTPEKKEEMAQILNQEFYYLGKGCQSYVFASRDGDYVIKFFKYQRFKPQIWLDSLTWVPFLDAYRLDRMERKRKKLEYAFASWKLAAEELQSETGVLYAHFNKTTEWPQKLIVYDKMGFKHELDLNSLEFMVQKRAKMLCKEILSYKKKNDLASGQSLIDKLIALLLNEYARGYADNDHALMQNTGVFDKQPIHIDVGQFVKNPIAADPAVYHQELFNKMWKFRRWLHEHYPELADYTDQRLEEAIGPSFAKLKPELNKANMGRIPVLL